MGEECTCLIFQELQEQVKEVEAVNQANLAKEETLETKIHDFMERYQSIFLIINPCFFHHSYFFQKILLFN